MERYNNNRYPMRRPSQQNMPGRCQEGRPGNFGRMAERRRSQDCGCENQGSRLAENINAFPVAMAYVPWQRWGETYEMGRGLNIGTLFPELNKPFMCTRCAK